MAQSEPMRDRIAELATDLRAAADPKKSPGMESYLRDQFEFLGVASPERKAITKPLMKWARTAEADQVLELADWAWDQEEREFQYVGVDVLVANRRLDGAALDRVIGYIQTKSWWDTVDALAANVVGPILLRSPDCVDAPLDWIDDDDFWVARTALLYQLKYKGDTDADRLFAFCTRRAADEEFFIRKAIGWALRQYAKTNPDAVRAYVAAHPELSGLSRREAMKHL